MTRSPKQFDKLRANAIFMIFLFSWLIQPTVLIEKVLAQNGFMANSVRLDDREALNAQADHAIKREITVEARVKKLLPEDTRGLPHEKFLIELSNGTTILIAHDLKMAPSVPIQPGDILRIHGEYIWNSRGGLIHWTHHTDTPRHEGGWIDFNGTRYQ